MRAIIIQDTDARALTDALKLERFEQERYIRGETKEEIIGEVHARFHYIVTRWLQEQGAQMVR